MGLSGFCEPSFCEASSVDEFCPGDLDGLPDLFAASPPGWPGIPLSSSADWPLVLPDAGELDGVDWPSLIGFESLDGPAPFGGAEPGAPLDGEPPSGFAGEAPFAD